MGQGRSTPKVEEVLEHGDQDLGETKRQSIVENEPAPPVFGSPIDSEWDDGSAFSPLLFPLKLLRAVTTLIVRTKFLIPVSIVTELCFFCFPDVSFMASLDAAPGGMPKAPLASGVDLEPGSSVDKEEEEREEKGEPPLRRVCTLTPNTGNFFTRLLIA